MSEGGPPVTTGVKGETQLVELDRGERSIARRSAESRATVPTVEFGCEVDAGPLLERVSSGEVPGAATALLLRAVAHGLRTVPRVNAAYRDGHFELYSRVNVGLTITSDELYVIPTVFDVDDKTIEELVAEVADLRARAAAGELSPAELSGATFTLTDASSKAAGTVTPLVVPPQAAALCAGPICSRAVVRNGDVAPGHTMSLFLACDHRIVYGAHATAFIEAVGAHLEEGLC